MTFKGGIMKFGVIKKRLAAGLTMLALAVSNLSGLELGAEATLLDIREYKATAVLNSISDDDMSHCKLSQLMGTLTDVQALNKSTGEYEPVDFVLPDDYSAVWVNGEEYDVYEGKDAELDLSDL